MQIGYDYAGNRLWREDVKAAASRDLDELYVYDGLNRLIDLRRGDVNTAALTLGNENWEEAWTLDPLGNWSGYDQEINDSDTLVQSRLHNKANEIDNDDDHANTPSGSITATTGANWVDPVHDAAGNMTTMPTPGDPNQLYTATYDAWNRLVELHNENDLLAEHEYDGLNQRIVKNIYSEEGASALHEVRHFYYNDRWQCLEENIEEKVCTF